MYQKLENYGQVFLFEVTAKNFLVKMIFLAKSLSILLGCRDIAGKFTSKFCVVTASSRKVSANRAGILPEQEKPLAQSFGCGRFVYNNTLRFRTGAFYKDGQSSSHCEAKNVWCRSKKSSHFLLMFPV